MSTGYSTFEDWFAEQEGFSVRAERFDGDVAWLKAAFEAGRLKSVAGVDVKPLEWELLGGDSWRASALFFGSFRVENFASGYIVLWSAPGISDTFIEGRWPTAEAAKAAAEADYRQRILSALSVADQEPVDTQYWDIQEFRVWKGIDPERPVWASRGFCCPRWDGANELLEFLQHNDNSLILRVAPLTAALKEA